ncbi:hypothetical protein SMICM17S_05527 [Streptomyces microflavus]
MGVFGIFYTAAVSYSWMMFFVTVMVGVLYGVLGVLDAALLWLRVAETAVGALGAVLAVLVILPVTTHAITDAWIRKALRCVHACTAEAAERLAGSLIADPGPRVAELDVLLGRVRLSLAPLVHPQPAEGPQGTGPAGARPARRLRTRSARPGLHRRRPGRLARRPAVGRLLTGGGGRGGLLSRRAGGKDAVRVGEQPGTAMDPALAHLHGLERALAGLASPRATLARGARERLPSGGVRARRTVAASARAATHRPSPAVRRRRGPVLLSPTSLGAALVVKGRD